MRKLNPIRAAWTRLAATASQIRSWINRGRCPTHRRATVSTPNPTQIAAAGRRNEAVRLCKIVQPTAASDGTTIANRSKCRTGRSAADALWVNPAPASTQYGRSRANGSQTVTA